MTTTKEALARQYRGAYGPFVAGDYRLGQQVRAHGASGEIVWSYRNRQGLLTYVIDDESGLPVEIVASSIIEVS